MKNKQLYPRLASLIICMVAVMMLTACAPLMNMAGEMMGIIEEEVPALAEEIAPVIPEIEAPEEAADPQTAEVDEPAKAAPVPQGEVWLDDMLFPGAEFLFAVDGFGGPIVPWRFYAAWNASVEEAAAYYSERLQGFNVEYDEIVDGHRQLLLAHPDPMGHLSAVEGIDELEAVSRAYDGALLGVEVSHSGAHTHLNRLGIAINEYEMGDEIPENTTIIILEHFSNIY